MCVCLCVCLSCPAGKMPLNPEAFTKTKAALGVQLASALSAAAGAHVTATEEALEVLWQGFAFKLILYLDRWVSCAGRGFGLAVEVGQCWQQQTRRVAGRPACVTVMPFCR